LIECDEESSALPPSSFGSLVGTEDPSLSLSFLGGDGGCGALDILAARTRKERERESVACEGARGMKDRRMGANIEGLRTREGVFVGR
jgi:hypothetical protein